MVPSKLKEASVKLISKVALYPLACVLLVACNKGNERSATTGDDVPSGEAQTSAGATAARTAAESIAQSRCQREEACSNVGGDKKYSSVSDCLTRIRASWKEDLSTRECPGGVNQSQLDQCLSKIRREECSSPFDTLSRISECTANQICES